jgi:hypothetical protein
LFGFWEESWHSGKYALEFNSAIIMSLGFDEGKCSRTYLNLGEGGEDELKLTDVGVKRHGSGRRGP